MDIYKVEAALDAVAGAQDPRALGLSLLDVVEAVSTEYEERAIIDLARSRGIEQNLGYLLDVGSRVPGYSYLGGIADALWRADYPLKELIIPPAERLRADWRSRPHDELSGKWNVTSRLRPGDLFEMLELYGVLPHGTPYRSDRTAAHSPRA